MQTNLPRDALLARYAVDADGGAFAHYTDCFSVTVHDDVDLERYVKAFYTTPLFRSERLVLRLVGSRSRDSDIDAVLAGRGDRFAAWTVEDRTARQLLMCDVNGRTRSWFMVEELTTGETRLYFGSAVLADGDAVPTSYGVLLSLHRLYSRALLSAARRLLERRRQKAAD